MSVCSKTVLPAPGQEFLHGKTEKGFTLLELLIVVSILSAVAALAATSMSGLETDTQEKLALTEMQTIAEAVRQFKRDTGYYPKTGPFNLNYGGAKGSVIVDKLRATLIIKGLGEFDSSSGSMKDDIDLAYWFNSPANLYQLVWTEDELPGMEGHMLETWNPETGRGWNGPYLTGVGDGVVNIGSGASDGSIDGNRSGNPEEGTSTSGVVTVLRKVYGVADPFLGASLVSDIFKWYRFDGTNWNEVTDSYDRHERPYLIYNLGSSPEIVSMGPDGEYGSSDDIVVEME